MGQATNLAAVALFLNTNRTLPSAGSTDVEAAMGTGAGSGQCYHSEPERISNYRNSVAFIDAEVEALLACRGHRKGSKFHR